ncbi:MAG TPA: hypothetical protein VF681_03550 [Abditibacteriaceae bacterium]|jgi:hypothetical protein
METKIYRIPQQAKNQHYRALFMSIVAALMTTYAAAFAPPRSGDQWTYLLLLVVITYTCVAFFIWYIWVLSAYLEVTETHIIHHTPKKAAVALAWCEIVGMEEARNTRSQGRLALYSSSRNTKIIIESETEGYEVLRHLIIEKTGKAIG